MNVIENMLMIYNTTRTEDTNHRILYTWLTSLHQVPKMKIAELADYSYTSTSTVNRLIHILGFSKYTAFIHALQTCIDQYPGLNHFSPPSAAAEGSGIHDAFLNIIHTYLDEIRRLADTGCFTEISKAMHDAPQVTIFSYAAMLCEFNLQFDLFLSGTTCEVIPYDIAKLEYSRNLTPDSFVLVFYPNRLDDLAILREVLANAARHHCTVCLVSSFARLGEMEGVSIFVPFTGGTPASDAFFFQMFIASLTTEYRKHYPDPAIETV